MRGRTSLILKTSFDSAHYLPNYEGPCHKLHGHTWNVEVYIEGGVNDDSGMIADFKDVKDMIKQILPDHELINTVVSNPTAENISKYLYDRIKTHPLLPTHCQVTKVILWETPSNGVCYEL